MTLRPSPSSRTRGCPATGRKPYPSRPDAERALARREAEGRAVHCKACARWHAVVEHKRKKAMPRASGKKREEIRVRADDLGPFLLKQRGPMCQRCGAAPWTDKHEILARSQGGDPLDPLNIACLCNAAPGNGCHEFCRSHRPQAQAEGWVLSPHPGRNVGLPDVNAEWRGGQPHPLIPAVTVEGESK